MSLLPFLAITQVAAVGALLASVQSAGAGASAVFLGTVRRSPEDGDVVGIEEFTLFSADYGAQLQRLKQARPECLIVWGLSDNTAGIAKGLDG